MKLVQICGDKSYENTMFRHPMGEDVFTFYEKCYANILVSYHLKLPQQGEDAWALLALFFLKKPILYRR